MTMASAQNQVPALSVIVPAHNARDLLPRCLEAVRAQAGWRPGEIELIVVDDGSTDETGSAAAGRCDNLIRLETNQGAATARNRGAQAARGALLVFVDADVILRPTALASIRKEFEKDPGVAAVVGRYAERPAAAGLIAAYHNAFTRYHHDLSPRDMDWFWGALGAVRAEAFARVGGFDERYRGASAEDMELGLALSRAGFKIVYGPEAEGAHAHAFTLVGMLGNDYQKAVLGMKLRLAGRLPRRAPGFANFRNVLTMPLLFFAVYLIAAGNFVSVTPLAWLAAFFALGLVFVINDPYYIYLSKVFPRGVGYALLLHWLQMLTIGLGAAAGTLGYALGRSPYGRPGWI